MEDDNAGYRWETGYEKVGTRQERQFPYETVNLFLLLQTWETLTEDADGMLEVSVADAIRKARRKRMLEKTGKRVRLGMMRHLYVVLDMSECMNMQVRWKSCAFIFLTKRDSLDLVKRPSRFVALLDTILFLQDLKPTRFRCCLKLLESFVEEFFYLNPISQLGVISTRNKRAEVISDLSGNPRRHVETLRSLAASSGGGAAGQSSCRGEPSLQNSLEVALQSLRHMPAHASRELLFVAGSLTTCDPGDIEATVQECKKANVRCSVVSLAAEVRIYHHLAKETGGDFGVILDDVHFRDLLQVGNCFFSFAQCTVYRN